VSGLRSLYAQAYRLSAGTVVSKLKTHSDSGLRAAAKDWLRAEALMVDLYDVERA
jgi:hypothetical protein